MEGQLAALVFDASGRVVGKQLARDVEVVFGGAEVQRGLY